MSDVSWHPIEGGQRADVALADGTSYTLVSTSTHWWIAPGSHATVALAAAAAHLVAYMGHGGSVEVMQRAAERAWVAYRARFDGVVLEATTLPAH